MSDSQTEDLARSLLATLVEKVGAEAVTAFVAIATGESTQQAIEDVSLLAMAVVRGVLDVFEPDVVRAAIAAGYAVADAQADAVEAAKFGAPK